MALLYRAVVKINLDISCEVFRALLDSMEKLGIGWLGGFKSGSLTPDSTLVGPSTQKFLPILQKEVQQQYPKYSHYSLESLTLSPPWPLCLDYMMPKLKAAPSPPLF